MEFSWCINLNLSTQVRIIPVASPAIRFLCYCRHYKMSDKSKRYTFLWTLFIATVSQISFSRIIVSFVVPPASWFTSNGGLTEAALEGFGVEMSLEISSTLQRVVFFFFVPVNNLRSQRGCPRCNFRQKEITIVSMKNIDFKKILWKCNTRTV